MQMKPMLILIVILLILITIIISVLIGIFFNIATLTETTLKKTVIYDIYLNKVIYSEKDTDGNDINKVELIREIHTFIDSYNYFRERVPIEYHYSRERVPIEYHYSNGTVIFSEKNLYRSNIQCGQGTFLLLDTCMSGYPFHELEIGETKRINIFLHTDKKRLCHGMGTWIDENSGYPSCAEVPLDARGSVYCVNEEDLPFCYNPM